MKYVAKCEVWIEIDSDYADGRGEMEREVEDIIENLQKQPEVVKSVVNAGNMEFKEGRLVKWFNTWSGKRNDKLGIEEGIKFVGSGEDFGTKIRINSGWH